MTKFRFLQIPSLLLLGVFLVGNRSAVAQSANDSERKRIEQLIKTVESETTRLEKTISRLNSDTQENSDPTITSADLRSGELPNQNQDQDFESVVAEIGSRIQLIRQVRQRAKQNQIEAQALKEGPATNEVQTPPMVSETQGEPSMGTGQIIAENPPQVDPNIPTFNQPENFAHVNQPPTRVLNEVLDPFELGNSLFQLGEFDSALTNYRLAQRDQLDESDGIWLDFMIANCLRKLKRWDEAEAIYREVANRNDNVQPIPTAQIWLEQLPQLKQLDSTTVDINANYQTLIEKAETYLK